MLVIVTKIKLSSKSCFLAPWIVTSAGYKLASTDHILRLKPTINLKDLKKKMGTQLSENFLFRKPLTNFLFKAS